MINIAYIISYFGKDEELRTKRKEYHQKQIDWLFQQNPDIKIKILSQFYKDNEYIKHDQIEYEDTSELLLPAPARNILLKQFYNSDHDYCIFLDNDSILYPYYDSGNLIKNFNENFNKFDKVDMFLPIDPRKVPFRKRIEGDLELYNNFHVLSRASDFKSSLFFLRNTKKYRNKEFYFDENLELLHDYEYMHQFFIENIGVYTHMSIILKEFGSNLSTLVESNEYRKNVNKIEKIKIYEKYKDYGLMFKNERFNRRKFFNDNCNFPKTIKISKTEQGEKEEQRINNIFDF